MAHRTRIRLLFFVDDAALSYTGAGASAIALRGSTALSGNIAAGQKLTVESMCGPHSGVARSGSFTNAGTMALRNETCTDPAFIVLSGGTLTNTGTLQVLRGGGRQIQGSVASSGTLAIEDGVTLSVTGVYSQTGAGSDFLNGTPTGTGFGLLSVGGTASLHGKLTLKHDPSFNPSLGSSFGIVGAGTRTGTFSKVLGAILDKPNGI